MSPWKHGKLRRLNPQQRQQIREAALEAFADDARNDPRYAVETVEHLADKANVDIRWWLEFLSSDPGCWKDLLGFDPLEPR